MKRRLLLVDDDPDVLDALEVILGGAYELSFAEDGDEALRRLETEPFDCVVLDLMMPRVNGASVMLAMREKALVVPVILVSAALDIAQQAATLGARDHMTKPFDVELLEAKIARIVDGTGSPPAAPSRGPGPRGGTSSSGNASRTRSVAARL